MVISYNGVDDTIKLQAPSVIFSMAFLLLLWMTKDGSVCACPARAE